MGQRPAADDDFDPKIAALIRHKVRRMIGTNGLRRDDEPDLRQELSLHVVRQMHRYDATRASAVTFAAAIIARRASDLVNHRRAKQRDARRCESFEDGAGGGVHDIHADGHRIDVAREVRVAFESLSPELRPIATLFEHQTVAQIARVTHRSRQQVRTLRSRIRAHFTACGLAPEQNLRPSNHLARRSRT